MQFLPDEVNQYAEAHTSSPSQILLELDRETHLKHLMPQMLSGHLQGQFLSLISQMIKPQNILEIGTYTGYSAICLLDGLQEGGKLDTIDVNDELKALQDHIFAKHPRQSAVNQHIGPALELLPNLEGPYDLVFIDADKENYPNYLKAVLPKLSIGGYILGDNVLWSGKVLQTDEIANDLETRSLHEFNQAIQANPHLQNILIPIRDGLMLAQKLA